MTLPADRSTQVIAADALSAQDRAKIDALFKEYTAGARPGCALGVMRDGRLTYARGYGLADVERRVPIAPTTLFDIGSTSKQFTAAAVILLEQEGKLALSDDVRKHVPEIPDYGRQITIDHLMRHTSGLRDYNALLSLAGLETEVTNDAQALATIVRQRKLNFPTGSRYEYSNTGYFLMAVIVQRVSGKSLAQFARERMFLPLGMTHSQFRDRYATIIPDRALGYTADDASPDGAPGFRNAVSNWEQTGDGSLHLSIEEAQKWDENFYQPRLGGRELVERLQQTGTLDNGETISYARGLVVDEYRGLRRVQHGGNWVGYNAMLMQFPAQHTSVATFCNFEGGEAARLSERVVDVVLADDLGPAETAPTPQDPVAIAQKKLLPNRRFVGRYFAAESDAVFDVTEQQGALALKVGSTSLPLTAVGPTKFAVAGYPATVEFSLADGQEPARTLELGIGDDPPTRATRFAPAALTVTAIQDYTGTFYSPELDLSWPIVVEDGHLAVRREKRKFIPSVEPLEPAMSDAFTSESGLMRFTRDSSGRVSGFDLSSSRMRGIRFELQAGANIDGQGVTK